MPSIFDAILSSDSIQESLPAIQENIGKILLSIFDFLTEIIGEDKIASFINNITSMVATLIAGVLVQLLAMMAQLKWTVSRAIDLFYDLQIALRDETVFLASN